MAGGERIAVTASEDWTLEDLAGHQCCGCGRPTSRLDLEGLCGSCSLDGLDETDEAYAAWCSCAEERVGGVHDPDCPTCWGEGVPVGGAVP